MKKIVFFFCAVFIAGYSQAQYSPDYIELRTSFQMMFEEAVVEAVDPLLKHETGVEDLNTNEAVMCFIVVGKERGEELDADIIETLNFENIESFPVLVDKQVNEAGSVIFDPNDHAVNLDVSLNVQEVINGTQITAQLAMNKALNSFEAQLPELGENFPEADFHLSMVVQYKTGDGFNAVRVPITRSEVGSDENTLEELVDENVTLYPNPAIDALYIKGLQDPATVMVTDMFGRTVLFLENQIVRQIDVSDFAPGTYLVQIGKNTERIIVQ